MQSVTFYLCWLYTWIWRNWSHTSSFLVIGSSFEKWMTRTSQTLKALRFRKCSNSFDSLFLAFFFLHFFLQKNLIDPPIRNILFNILLDFKCDTFPLWDHTNTFAFELCCHGGDLYFGISHRISFYDIDLKKRVFPFILLYYYSLSFFNLIWTFSVTI